MMGLGQGLGLSARALSLLGGSTFNPQYPCQQLCSPFFPTLQMKFIYLEASQTECISRFSTSSEGVTFGTVCQWDTYTVQMNYPG